MLKIDDKKKIVAELQAEFTQAKLVVFTDYRGLTVDEISELRNKLKPMGAHYQVAKNTLTRFAIKEAGMENLEEFTQGPNAIIFADEDLVGPAKLIFDFAKVHKNLEIKGGSLEGKVIDLEGLRSLSKLPPREVLLAHVAGTLAAPMVGFATVLKANLSGLARVLDAIREQKESA
ncbi:MAG: 50S ribosomal protein L10 [Methylocystaceae bacterium]